MIFLAVACAFSFYALCVHIDSSPCRGKKRVSINLSPFFFGIVHCTVLTNTYSPAYLYALLTVHMPCYYVRASGT